MWQVKPFSALTVTELHQILQLRTAVFVVDQKRIYQEVDDLDKTAWHLFATVDGQVVAYARIFELTPGGTVSFGRVVTNPRVRGQGFGGQLLDQIMTTIAHQYPGQPIEIEAQVQVQSFYQRAGFKSQGAPFVYQSTPHIKMVHAPLPAE
ncbi:MAG: GNAT family N-acetyltransferase [Limosilactobacillus gorillae]|uniref:GNAT family N-acetyltransferase n=1 Tax=Limosilactobacillus gorillae TaxID=1450649 RepID=UPI000AD61326|nr:GNAT family N-acetyltransferase [Limosilactobacillus gorillae]MDO4855018.1 GNAT family N-acetyltransferase [Limosilactobacillus gorillae]